MEPEELRKIDKRVAVELGATVEWHDKFGRSGYKLRQLCPLPLGSNQTAPYYSEDGLFICEENAWSKVCYFTLDPRATNLMCQEIERRGWVWSIGPYEGKPYCAMVTGGSYRCSKPPYGIVVGDTWMEALCLAFLAACEATKGASHA